MSLLRLVAPNKYYLNLANDVIQYHHYWIYRMRIVIQVLYTFEAIVYEQMLAVIDRIINAQKNCIPKHISCEISPQ